MFLYFCSNLECEKKLIKWIGLLKEENDEHVYWHSILGKFHFYNYGVLIEYI